MSMDNIMEIIEQRTKELRITSLDISFNELADMYSDGELKITSDHKRTFRWELPRQSRFIESLLLEMPVPPIYVMEVDDGSYELIDGLQRISSYLNYRGMLNSNDKTPVEQDSELAKQDKQFLLEGCDIIPEINGKSWKDLPSVLRNKLKRCFVRLEVLRRGFNPKLKYHMFKRVNTGGERLSEQETRNCTVGLIDSKFINFINRMATNQDFISTIRYVSEKFKKKKVAEELVLRFFAFKNNMDNFVHDVSLFLTAYMEEVSLADISGRPIFDYEKEEEIFNLTFEVLNKTIGKSAFAVYKSNSENLSGFNVYQYEAITTGIQVIYDNLKKGEIPYEQITDKLCEAKRDLDFKAYTVGGGKNSSGVLRKRFEFIAKKMMELMPEDQAV